MRCHMLTNWGRATHICVSKLTIIASDNGLSPGRRQAIIWSNAGILLFGPLGTDFSEILIEILIFSSKKMCLKVSSAKWRPFCLGLNVLSLEQSFQETTITRRIGWQDQENQYIACARFLSLPRSKLRLCSANHRPCYWSKLPWAYSA